MKTSLSSLTRLAVTAAVGAACVAAIPRETQAQSPFWDRGRPDIRRDRDRDGRHDWDRDGRHDWDRDRHRRSYYGIPRSNFVITFGNGYAGRGYDYGPPRAPYFYEAPGVRFFRSRTLVPTHYWGTPSRGPQNVIVRGSLDARVQTELARRGYYRGPIDGDIGPMSRSAIARFQAERGLPVTGSINSSLLSALGLY